MALSKMYGTGLPSDVDIDMADQLRSILASAEPDAEGRISFRIANGSAEIVLTERLAEIMQSLLRLISSGNGFQIVPYGAELSTQEAADMLNVSRPYLIKLLDQENIEYHRVNKHRRIKAEEIFSYMERRDANRSRALDALMDDDSEYL